MDKHAGSIYTSLPDRFSIRVLSIHPAESGPRSCSLQIVEDYRNGSNYIAVSYCWGDANDTLEITCNGQKIAITRTLENALQKFRKKDEEVLIWADALCINQADTKERNQQVSIMARIYEKASQVNLWLGQSDEQAERAIELIRKIWDHRFGDKDAKEIEDFMILFDQQTQHEVFPASELALWPALTAEDLDMLITFCGRAWFSRVWVIQEVRESGKAVAHCGEHSIPFDHAGYAISGVCRMVQDQKPPYVRSANIFEHFVVTQRAKLTWRLGVHNAGRDTFLGMLERTREFKATEQRDKIFAMQHYASMLRPTDVASQPDYDLPVVDLFRQAALHSITESQTLEILTYAARHRSNAANWPSWVPNWLNNNPILFMVKFSLYDASGGLPPKIKQHSDPNVLEAYGYQIGIVEDASAVIDFMHHSPVDPTSTSIEETLEVMLKMILQDTCVQDNAIIYQRLNETQQIQLAHFAAFLLSTEPLEPHSRFVPLLEGCCNKCEEWFARVGTRTASQPVVYHCDICSDGNYDLCETCFSDGQTCGGKTHRLVKTPLLCARIPVNRMTRDVLVSLSEDGDLAMFYRNLGAIIPRAPRFLKTQHGWNVFATTSVEVGDVVVVLHGATTPFVLRQVQRQYKLVSDCYVNGFMDGEVIQNTRSGTVAPSSFEIR